MALVGSPLVPRIVHDLRGVIDIYHHKWYGTVCRQWPKWHQPLQTGAWKRSADKFRSSWTACKTLSQDERDTLADTWAGYNLTWCDAFRKSFLLCPPTHQPWFSAFEATVLPSPPTYVLIRFPMASFCSPMSGGIPPGYPVYTSPVCGAKKKKKKRGKRHCPVRDPEESPKAFVAPTNCTVIKPFVPPCQNDIIVPIPKGKDDQWICLGLWDGDLPSPPRPISTPLWFFIPAMPV